MTEISRSRISSIKIFSIKRRKIQNTLKILKYVSKNTITKVLDVIKMYSKLLISLKFNEKPYEF